MYFWNRHRRRSRNMVFACGGEIRVIYGRRKCARSWQEHFGSILRSEEARQRGFTVESHPKCPTLHYVREADGVIQLHVDDGHGCGKETIVAE